MNERRRWLRFLGVAVLAAVAVVVSRNVWSDLEASRSPRADKPYVDPEILRYDPIVRDADGNPTGTTRTLPDGWVLCDGENGTVKLTGGKTQYITRVTAGAPPPEGSSHGTRRD